MSCNFGALSEKLHTKTEYFVQFIILKENPETGMAGLQPKFHYIVIVGHVNLVQYEIRSTRFWLPTNQTSLPRINLNRKLDKNTDGQALELINSNLVNKIQPETYFSVRLYSYSLEFFPITFKFIHGSNL